MSKWLQSTTGLSYTAKGKVIGKDPVQVSDAEVDAIIKAPVIASLIKNGAVKVLDKYDAPADTGADSIKLRALTEENAKLADEIRALKAAGANKAEVEELKAKLEEAEKKYADLEKEAKEAIAQLQAELEEAKSEKTAKKAKKAE